MLCKKPQSTQSVDSFRNLIFLGSFICLNRFDIINCLKTKALCFCIYFTVIISGLYIVLKELTSETDPNFKLIFFQLLFVIELFGLACASQFSRNQIAALKKLDDKFGVDDDYCAKLKTKADIAVVVTVISLVIDVCGLTALSVKPGLMLTVCLASAAHDAELAMISLFIEVVNLRLAKSITANPSFGCAVYRHVLIAMSYFNGEFQFSILLIWLITLFTTIIYGFSIVVMEFDRFSLAVSYIAWREFKSLYSIWIVCKAAYRTEGICQLLEFHLAAKLILDPKISNGKHSGDISSKKHRTLKRWFTSVVSLRPRFNAGQGIPVSLNIPLVILDVSINYLLLVIQFYMAHK